MKTLYLLHSVLRGIQECATAATSPRSLPSPTRLVRYERILEKTICGRGAEYGSNHVDESAQGGWDLPLRTKSQSDRAPSASRRYCTQDRQYLPAWVSDLARRSRRVRQPWLFSSIGAINAALIAGNPPETRLEKPRQFWECATIPTSETYAAQFAAHSKQWPISRRR
jgi:hypothetical protein